MLKTLTQWLIAGSISLLFISSAALAQTSGEYVGNSAVSNALAKHLGQSLSNSTGNAMNPLNLRRVSLRLKNCSE